MIDSIDKSSGWINKKKRSRWGIMACELPVECGCDDTGEGGQVIVIVMGRLMWIWFDLLTLWMPHR